MLAILACPVTRTKLRWDGGAEELISDAAGLAYPVRDGVPVLLVEEARHLNPPRNGEGDHAKHGGGAGAV
jgi:hypothetical protein